MGVNIFVYGPLMLGDVIKTVVGRELTRRGGTVHGYLQLRVKDQSQAALIPFPDAVTEGVVYLDVGMDVLRLMDAYLGKAFQRGDVNVQVGEGEWVEAETHFFRLSRRKELSAKPWDEEEFRRKGLAGKGIEAPGAKLRPARRGKVAARSAPPTGKTKGYTDEGLG